MDVLQDQSVTVAVSKGKREKEDFQVWKAIQVCLDFQVLKGLQGLVDKRVMMDFQGHQDQKESEVLLDFLDFQGHPAFLECQAMMGPQDLKVSLDAMEPRESVAFQAVLVFLVYRVLQGLLGSQV